MSDKISQAVEEVVKAASLVNVRETQAALEFVKAAGLVNVRETQAVLEVVKGPVGPIPPPPPPPNPPPTPGKAPTRCPLNFDQLDEITIACPVLGTPAIIGIPYSRQMVITGGTAPLSFLLTIGPLPPGLSLNALTGFITGTPTTLGSFPFTIQVIDFNGNSDFASCLITIMNNVALAVTCPLTNIANLGAFYTGTLIPSGGTGPYTYAINSGALPTGVTLAGAVISGIPTVTGTFNYTVRVTDSLANFADSPCQLIVNAPLPPVPPPPSVPIITTLTIPGGTQGFFYPPFQFEASGSTPINWTATGVPTGMFLSTLGVLTGTPTVSGSFNIVVTAHNSAGASAPVTFPINIAISGVAPVITSTSPLPDGNIGTPYSFTFTATGTAPLTWAALIPSTGGWAFDVTTATFSNPDPPAGTITIQVQVYNGAGVDGYHSYDLTIQNVPLPPPPPPIP